MQSTAEAMKKEIAESQSSGSRGSRGSSRIKCWYCGNVGHPEHMCRKKKADEQGGKKGEPSEGGSAADSCHHWSQMNDWNAAAGCGQSSQSFHWQSHPHSCPVQSAPMFYGNPLGCRPPLIDYPETDSQCTQGKMGNDLFEGRVIAVVDRMLSQGVPIKHPVAISVIKEPALLQRFRLLLLVLLLRLLR